MVFASCDLDVERVGPSYWIFYLAAHTFSVSDLFRFTSDKVNEQRGGENTDNQAYEKS